MSKGWKWFGLLLVCTALCLGILPVTVWAAQPDELWVNGTDITKAPDYTVVCGGGTAVYDPNAKTLTLTDATMETGNLTSRVIEISQNEEVEIILNGDNQITWQSNAVFVGAGSKVTFCGSGNLTINAGSSSGIVSKGIVIVDGARLTAICTGDGAIMVDEDFIIQNGATVVAKGTYYGVQAGNLSISGNSILDVTSSEANCNALSITNNGDLLVSGSAVKAEATSNQASPAIYVSGDIIIENAAEVTAESKGMRGIYTDGDMTINDSTVIATGTTQEGMIVVGRLTVNRSKLTASSKPNDIIPAIVTEQLHVTASDVTAKGGLQLYDWGSGDADNASFSITPAAGELAEFKVDGTNWDGSAAVHFQEGPQSPYDTTVNFDATTINCLDAYRYVHIKALSTATPHTYTIVRRDGYLSTGEEYWAEPPKEEAIDQPDAEQPATNPEDGKDNPSMGGRKILCYAGCKQGIGLDQQEGT